MDPVALVEPPEGAIDALVKISDLDHADQIQDCRRAESVCAH